MCYVSRQRARWASARARRCVVPRCRGPLERTPCRRVDPDHEQRRRGRSSVPLAECRCRCCRRSRRGRRAATVCSVRPRCRDHVNMATVRRRPLHPCGSTGRASERSAPVLAVVVRRTREQVVRRSVTARTRRQSCANTSPSGERCCRGAMVCQNAVGTGAGPLCSPFRARPGFVA